MVTIEKKKQFSLPTSFSHSFQFIWCGGGGSFSRSFLVSSKAKKKKTRKNILQQMEGTHTQSRILRSAQRVNNYINGLEIGVSAARTTSDSFFFSSKNHLHILWFPGTPSSCYWGMLIISRVELPTEYRSDDTQCRKRVPFLFALSRYFNHEECLWRHTILRGAANR